MQHTVLVSGGDGSRSEVELISVFTKVHGGFCLRLQLLPLERLHSATKLQPKLCADSGLCESLWEL